MTAKKAPRRPRKTGPVTDGHTEPETVYRGIFESAGIPMAVIDENAMISLVNKKFEELSGYSRGEIETKKPWQEFVVPDDIDKLTKYHAGVLKPEGWAPPQFSFGFVDRHGMVRDMSASISLTTGTRKCIISLVDITPRKKVERMLRLNEDRYQTLVKNLNTGVFRMTHELPGRFIWANPAFLSLFGYTSLADLFKITPAEFFADTKDLDHIQKDLTDSGFTWLEKTRLKKIDGTPIWASITAEVKHNEDGASGWIDGTVENITGRVLAEEELKQTQSRLRELLDAITTYSLFATDPDGILTIFNTGSERLLGYREEDLVGKETPLLFLHAPEAASCTSPQKREDGTLLSGFAAFVSGVKTNGYGEWELVYVRKDGREIPVVLTMTVMRGEDGAVTGYVGVAQDISDRKRLEEAFRYDKLQMSGVIYNIPEPTFAIDREGKVIAWNRAMEELSGIKAVDILGKGDYEYAIPFYGERKPMLADLIFATESELEEEGFINTRRSGNSISAEILFTRHSGPALVLRGMAAPIYDDTGEVAGSVESITDITEILEKESALRDSESRFRAIVDHIGSAVAVIDEDSTISYINPEFERIIGYVRNEIEGKKKWSEFIVPEDQERLREYQHRYRTHPKDIPVRFEFRFIRWDGQVRSGYTSITPMPGTGKIVASLIDITDRVLAEEAVRRANKKLNFFSSFTRHDILNQLTGLKGNLELSREYTSDRELLSSIEKELAAAEAIQNQIVFTRDYQDIGIQPPEWQNVRQLILRSCSGMKLKDLMVTVLVEGVEVYADLLLGRVFYHLIDNAIRHGGTLTQIRFTCNESFEELVLVCEDDGVGIPADAKEKIFTRQHFADLGLGMFVSREILSITGISIRETGIPGEGARFEIRVPKGAYRFVSEVP